MPNPDDDVVVPADERARATFDRVFKFTGQQAPAIRCSNEHGRLPIFGFDQAAAVAKKRGAKDYVVTSYNRLWPYMEAQPRDRRCFYEILLHQKPTKIHIDIDADLRLNPTLTPFVVEARTIELMAELRCLLSELTHNPDLRTAPYLTLGSSTLDKLSLHLLMSTFMRNNYEVGALIRRLRNRVLRKHEKEEGKGDRDNDHPFFIWHEEKDVSQPLSADGERPLKRVRRFFCDLKIYTKRRNFRLYGSSKEGDYRPLRLQHENADAPLNPEVFQKCMLQRLEEGTRVYACREIDGSLASSIADVDIFRYDLQQSLPSARPRNNQAHVVVDEATLQTHWTSIFPAAALWDFLRVDEEQASGEWKREFIFVDRRDKWKRHQTFRSAAELVQSLVAEAPSTLHVGPLESVGTKGVLQTCVVFDVDIRDYAPWRSCCAGRDTACAKCWPLAQFAFRALKAFVEDEYAIGTAWAFFSGGKGIHVWVQTPALEETLTRQGSETIIGDFHSVKNAASLSRQYIQTTLGSAADRKNWRTFLCKDMGLTAEFEGREHAVGRDRAIIEYMWPELDASVTIDPQHPLKAPFSRHAKTGNVCVWLRDTTTNPFASDAAAPADVAQAFAEAIQQ